MRFYLSRVIGSGIGDDAFRPKISEYFASWSIVDARADVLQAAGWMFVNSDPTELEHSQAIADADIKYLQLEDVNGNSLPLTATLSDVAHLSAIKTYLETHHIPTDGLALTDTIATALRVIARRFLLRQVLQSNDFSENLDLTIGDIPTAKRQAIAARLTKLGFDISGLTQSTVIRDALKTLIAQNNKWLPRK